MLQEQIEEGDPDLKRFYQETEFTKEEEARIAELVREYDEDIDLIAQRISKIKNSHQKFDNLGRARTRVSKIEQRDHGNGKLERVGDQLKSLRDQKKKKTDEEVPAKKEKDCVLI